MENRTYTDSPELAVNMPVDRPSSFFRTMLAMAALDIILLFWILNPLSKPANSLPAWHRASAPVQHAVVIDTGLKPSPLGAIAKRLVPSGTTAAPSTRRFITVAYRQ